MAGTGRSLPHSAQAQLAIPPGTVQNRRQYFEALINTSEWPTDETLVHRASAHVDDAIQNRQTYESRLQVAEALTLHHLPANLALFLRDHDAFAHGLRRSERRAETITNTANSDPLDYVEHRIDVLRNQFGMYALRATRGPEAWTRINMQHTRHEIHELSVKTQLAVVICLVRFEMINSQPADFYADDEYANVGPDHTIEDLGREVFFAGQFPDGTASSHSSSSSFDHTFDLDSNSPTDSNKENQLPPRTPQQSRPSSLDDRDHTLRCCICLGPYTAPHTAFLLHRCGHFIGKPCLATWLNSTARNATSCPHCRAEICPRRPRVPAGPSLLALELQRSQQAAEMARQTLRLARAGDLLSELEIVQGTLLGVEDWGAWFASQMRELNERLFYVGVGYVWRATKCV